MRERVVTLMWGDAFERYGKQFLDTFARHWPAGVELVVVTDYLRGLRRGQEKLLHNVCGYQAFMARYGADRRAQGYDSRHHRAEPNKRFWRADAVKWAPQGLAPRAAMHGLEDGDILAWFDADVHTTSKVREGWLGELLDGHDVACLQRQGAHSEIGFWAVRIGPETRRAGDAFANCYATGAVFDLPEQHSAHVFDWAIKGLKVRNLNARGIKGHPWPASPLAEFTVHKKGKLK